MCPNSRDGLESADPWGLVTDEIEEAIAKKKRKEQK